MTVSKTPSETDAIHDEWNSCVAAIQSKTDLPDQSIRSMKLWAVLAILCQTAFSVAFAAYTLPLGTRKISPRVLSFRSCRVRSIRRAT